MTQQEVLDLMKSGKDKADWNANCDKVQAAFNGQYPPFWYQEVILSKLADKVLGEGASEIKFTTW